MSIDAIFSPIRKINYEVENMRVGDRTDYNRLVIDIETDGTIMPEEALERSANILIEHYKIIASPIRKIANKESNKEAKKEPVTLFSEESELENAEKMKIEDLKFSQRTQNALLSNHIKTVGGIVTLSEEGLLELEGLGEKAVKEIKKALGKLGLTLKQ